MTKPPVHDAAMQGYAVDTGAYTSGRPDYPPEALEWLREDLGLGIGDTVLDLGAATGKFIPLLHATGATLLALEPVEAMRGKLMAQYPDVDVMAGSATAIPLEDASLDGVICAQAFHWFATKEALAEICRVLKPGGRLGLIWNVRDESVPWVAKLSALIDAHEGEVPRHKTGAWRAVFPAEGFELLGERRASNPHIGRSEQVVIDRTRSVSFIGALPASERNTLIAEVRALVAATPELCGNGDVTFPYQTEMITLRKTG